MKIEICGGIASGKTTLCSLLKTYNINSVFEKFQENPFLQAYYHDPARFSFETELTFLLQHYHSIKAAPRVMHCASDFSIVQDLAYADMNLSGQRHALFCEIEKNLRMEIGFPDVLICLTCTPEILLERIQKRKRPEEQTITLEYLQSLNCAIQKRVSAEKGIASLITIDSSEIDFRNELPSALEQFIQYD